jgi:hypothetical protein
MRTDDPVLIRDMEKHEADKADFKGRLEKGQEYQDFLTDILPRKTGLIPQFYSSKKYQVERGEGLGRIEAKFDGRFQWTGNLFIELEEKMYPGDQFYPSGWLHKKGIFFIIIGDRREFFLFDRTLLISITAGCRVVSTATAKGALLPVETAGKYAIAHIVIDQEELPILPTPKPSLPPVVKGHESKNQ